MDSQWRSRSAEYFADQEKNIVCHYNNLVDKPQKIALDLNYPLSFFADATGRCQLCSVGSSFDFNDLGSTNLGVSPNKVIHYGNWLLVAHENGVTQYETTSQRVASVQGIDDFVQIALTKENPTPPPTPVALSFFTCDIQVPTWPHPTYSVIDKSNLRSEEARRKMNSVVRDYKMNALKSNPFAVEETCKWDLPDQSFSSLPFSGPRVKGIKDICFSYKYPLTFQGIQGMKWYDWDIKTGKLKFVSNEESYELMSIDSSLLLRSTIAASSYGGTISLQDLRKKEIIHTFTNKEHTPISIIKFSPVVQPLLATASDNYTIDLWDLRGSLKKPFLTLYGHTNEISGLQFSNHRADILYTSSYDGTINVYNINNSNPPHHILQTVSPTDTPVLDIAAGYDRPDSVYFSCADGTTGVYNLTKECLVPVIHHRMESKEDKEAETLLYFRENQKLLDSVMPRINKILESKADVSPIFPLLNLVTLQQFDVISNNEKPIEELIDQFSYYIPNSIPSQLVQSPEPQMLAEAQRATLYANVFSGIQNDEPDVIIAHKKLIINAFEAFTRDQILQIVQTVAKSSYEAALDIGQEYLLFLTRNSKTEKFLDIGYFLLYPTVFDDPSEPFKTMSHINHTARSRLRSAFSNNSKINEEFIDMRGVLSTAANDEEDASKKIFTTLSKHDSFISMMLCRVFLSLCFVRHQWSKLLSTATQLMKDTDGFPFKGIINEWLESIVLPEFDKSIKEVIKSNPLDPPLYINVVADIIIASSCAGDLPQSFSDVINQMCNAVEKDLTTILSSDKTSLIKGCTPKTLAKAILMVLENNQHKMTATTTYRNRTAQEIVNKLKRVLSSP